MKIKIKEITIIVVIACVIAVFYNSFSIAGVSYLYKQEKEYNGAIVSLEEARDMVDNSDILFIDARPVTSYKVAHLPGAINVPYNSKDIDARVSDLDKDQSIVVYCYSKRCNMARLLGSKLSQLGFKRVALFDDGISVWQKHKYPIESSIANADDKAKN